MKLKISPLLWGDVVDIFISRLHCSEDNILKIVELFEYEYAIIEVGDVEASSSLFQAILSLNLKYTTSFHNDPTYSDIVLMVSGDRLKEILHHVFASECEYLALTSIAHQSQWEHYLYNQVYRQQLIKCKIITLSIVALITESQVKISFHKSTHDAKQIAAKIKNQFSKSTHTV